MLAQAAIAGAGKADPGQDGITYLLDAMAAGIETPLTAAYETEILRQTGSGSLQDALTTAKAQGRSEATKSWSNTEPSA
jgi:hypothetical protein